MVFSETDTRWKNTQKRKCLQMKSYEKQGFFFLFPTILQSPVPANENVGKFEQEAWIKTQNELSKTQWIITGQLIGRHCTAQTSGRFKNGNSSKRTLNRIWKEEEKTVATGANMAPLHRQFDGVNTKRKLRSVLTCEDNKKWRCTGIHKHQKLLLPYFCSSVGVINCIF